MKKEDTGYFGQRKSDGDLRQKWHGIVDSLENHFKSRVAKMRQKVDQLVPVGIKVDGNAILKDVVKEETRHVEERLRKSINLNQEKLIEELNAKLVLKSTEIAKLEANLGQTAKDLDLYRRKYNKLKHVKNNQFEDSIKDLKA